MVLVKLNHNLLLHRLVLLGDPMIKEQGVEERFLKVLIIGEVSGTIKEKKNIKWNKSELVSRRGFINNGT